MKFKLVEKFEEELEEDLLNEGIEDVKKYYPTIEDKDFERIIKLDPTTNIEKDKVGTYSKWLLNLYKNGKLSNEGHVTDLLNRFESEKNNLVNKDIMKYKSLEDVENMLNNDDSYKNKTHRQEVRQRQKDRRNVDLNKDAELVYEDSDWEVWVPKTYAASCRLGQETNWCTASTESDYYYNKYKDSYGGNYYININKHNPKEKYQFHFESEQFMDKNDYEIELSEFIKENPSLKKVYDPIVEKVIDELIETDQLNDNTDLSYTIDELSKALSGRDWSASTIEGFLSNDLTDIWEPYDYVYDRSDIETYYLSELDDVNKEALNNKGYDLDDTDNWPEDLWDILGIAVREAYNVGSQDEAVKDFWKALENALDETLEESQSYSINYNNTNILDIKNNNGPDNYYLLQHQNEDYREELLEKIYYNFKFYEPQYGWQEFDNDVFNEYVSDRLDEIEDAE